MHTNVSAIGLIAVVVIVGSAIGTRIAIGRQTTAYRALEQKLMQAAQPVRVASLSLENLPSPVARYLRWALDGRHDIGSVRLTQEGSLRTDARSERWMPFTATHVAVPRASGFVWRARVAVASLIHVRVRDALVEGTGSGQISASTRPDRLRSSAA